MTTAADAAQAYAALDECILSVLEDHKIDRWELDTVKGATWIICKCGQVDLAESDHRLHQAVQVSEMIERHKDLVFDLPSLEDNASKSRDFGRGFAHAVRLMREALDKGRFTNVEEPESADSGSSTDRGGSPGHADGTDALSTQGKQP